MIFDSIETIHDMAGFIGLVDQLSVNVFRTSEAYLLLPVPFCRQFYSVGGVLFAASGGGFMRVFESYQPHASLMLSIAEVFFLEEKLPLYATTVREFFAFFERAGIVRPSGGLERFVEDRVAWEAFDHQADMSLLCMDPVVRELDTPFELNAAWQEIPDALLRWGSRNKSALLGELASLKSK